MQFEFANKRGAVIFGGGSRNDFNLTKIEGLGLVEKTAQSAAFFGQPGQETINVTSGSRVITASGDLLKFERRIFANMMSVFDIPGIFTIIFPDGERRLIDVSYSSVTPGEEHGQWQQYVIQMHCDYPYFRSSNEKLFRAYEKINHLDSGFSLPGIFTTEYGRQVLNYEGNAPCTESQFIIYVSEKNDVELTEDEGIGISINNVTTNECIKFEYEMSAGDMFKINIGARQITNRSGEDLTRFISNDTFLDGFHLEPGHNFISVYNYQGNLEVKVMMFYTDHYAEAVF